MSEALYGETVVAGIRPGSWNGQSIVKKQQKLRSRRRDLFTETCRELRFRFCFAYFDGRFMLALLTTLLKFSKKIKAATLVSLSTYSHVEL